MAQEKPTVLYVDDVPMNLKLFEATFRKDYNIILTESPERSPKYLRREGGTGAGFGPANARNDRN